MGTIISEIADVLGISPTNVATKISRLKETMRQEAGVNYNMELDELKVKWAEYDRKLDESIRLNRQLLRESYTRRAKFALWRLAAMLAAGSDLHARDRSCRLAASSR